MTTVELACGSDLLCLVGLRVEHAVADVLDEVRALAAQTETTRDHVKLVFADPLDVMIGARHLDTAFSRRVYVSAIVASRTATEMLREPTVLARDTWAWLVARTGTEPPPGRGVLAIGHHGGMQLAPIPDALADGRLPAGRGLVVAVITRDCRIEHLTTAGDIGRTSAARIAIPDGNISRRHVGLEVDPQGVWTARDRGSTSGFYIAGRQSGSRTVTLHPGLVLQFARPIAVAVLAIR